jgi:hypothetical protein
MGLAHSLAKQVHVEYQKKFQMEVDKFISDISSKFIESAATELVVSGFVLAYESLLRNAIKMKLQEEGFIFKDSSQGLYIALPKLAPGDE